MAREFTINAEVSILELILSLRYYSRALTGDSTEADELIQLCLRRTLARRQVYKNVCNLKIDILKNLHDARDDRPLLRTSPGGRDGLGGLPGALLKLPEQQRRVLLLVGCEGLSYEDAAAVMGAPIDEIMSSLSLGREALRRGTCNNERSSRKKVPGRDTG